MLKSLRARWPGERLYVIADNFSPHQRAEVREWAAARAVGLVFLPTNSSWLTWVASEFATLRYFALIGTDHRSHGERDAAIGAYIRWHNQHVKPKRDFAANSKIRLPNCLPKVA